MPTNRTKQPAGGNGGAMPPYNVEKDNVRPPEASQFVWGVMDLPQDRLPWDYEIRNGEDDPTVFALKDRKRQVMDLLIQGPVYCASPVRISDIVHILKRDIGLDVETKMYPGNPETGAGSHGVYFLRSSVRRVVEAAQ